MKKIPVLTPDYPPLHSLLPSSCNLCNLRFVQEKKMEKEEIENLWTSMCVISLVFDHGRRRMIQKEGELYWYNEIKIDQDRVRRDEVVADLRSQKHHQQMIPEAGKRYLIMMLLISSIKLDFFFVVILSYSRILTYCCDLLLLLFLFSTSCCHMFFLSIWLT